MHENLRYRIFFNLKSNKTLVFFMFCRYRCPPLVTYNCIIKNTAVLRSAFLSAIHLKECLFFSLSLFINSLQSLMCFLCRIASISVTLLCTRDYLPSGGFCWPAMSLFLFFFKKQTKNLFTVSPLQKALIGAAVMSVLT